MEIENTKYILSNLIAYKKQINEEVIYSISVHTVLRSTKGDEMKQENILFLFLLFFFFQLLQLIT